MTGQDVSRASVCPCGCGGTVKPRRVYATRGCFLRATPGERRAEWGLSGAHTRCVRYRYTMTVVEFYRLRRAEPNRV